MRNTVFEKSFKSLDFGWNGNHPKFTVLVHFGAEFTTRKPKKLLKTKIYAKTASLAIPNNASPTSQKNHRIFVELSKKKLGLNCDLVPHQRFIKNSHISYNRVIHLLSGCQVSSSGYLLFSTLPRRNDNVYFGSGPNWPILGGLGAITPVNNVRLSWNFDHR